MTTKQLNGYRVEFYSEEEWEGEPLNIFSWSGGISMIDKIKRVISDYAGLVTEIPEELAEKIVSSWQDYESLSLDVSYNGYRDYKSSSTYEYAKYPFRDAKQSFQTLSNLPYCVITKN